MMFYPKKPPKSWYYLIEYPIDIEFHEDSESAIRIIIVSLNHELFARTDLDFCFKKFLCSAHTWDMATLTWKWNLLVKWYFQLEFLNLLVKWYFQLECRGIWSVYRCKHTGQNRFLSHFSKIRISKLSLSDGSVPCMTSPLKPFGTANPLKAHFSDRYRTCMRYLWP